MSSNRHRSSSGSQNGSDSDMSSDTASDYSKRTRSRSRSPRCEYRLHIAEIADNVKKTDIERVFEEYGGLKEVWMANSPPCFGFAVFKHNSNATAALKGTDGLMLGNSRIRVTHARPRTRGHGRRVYNTGMRCYQCGLPGHFYRDCPELCQRKYSRRTSRYYHSRRRHSYGRGEHRHSTEHSSDNDRKRRR